MKSNLILTIYNHDLDKVITLTKTVETDYIPFMGLSFNLPLIPSIKEIYYVDNNEFTCILNYRMGVIGLCNIYDTIDKLNNLITIYKNDGWKNNEQTYDEAGL